MNNTNFYLKIPKIKQILNRWQQRDLTIFGKILLIKTFALSQILYATAVLPVPKKFINDLDEIIYRFLWNGKTHKVKKSIVIQDESNGGCNMISINDMIHAQHITWVKKYLNDVHASWKTVMRSIIKVYRLDIFLQSNYVTPEGISEFYKNVLQTWQENRKSVINTPDEVLDQYLWYNKNLTGIPIHNRIMHDYIDKGILQIKHIMKGDGSFKTLQDMITEFNIDRNTYLFYQAVVNSILASFKRDHLQRNNNNDHTKNQLDTVSILPTKEIYLRLLRQKQETSKTRVKYTEMFDITDEEWQVYYTNPMQLQVINKAKEMQYKILHDYVASNKLLYKMGYISSPRCNFCNIYIQDTIHLFYECLDVKNFWFSLNERLMPISVTRKSILFGDISASNRQQSIVLYAKLFIFRCKYKDVTPALDTFTSWINRFMIV